MDQDFPRGEAAAVTRLHPAFCDEPTRFARFVELCTMIIDDEQTRRGLHASMRFESLGAQSVSREAPANDAHVSNV